MVLLLTLNCKMGTLEALKRNRKGGKSPGGRTRSTDCVEAEICARAISMRASGWKNRRITLTPFTDCDSICSMSLTVVVKPRSLTVAMRLAMSSAEMPV
jgi:hypothetical protein